MAREQTAGRGRADRSWASRHGNFMGTRLWHVGRDLNRVHLLSLATGMCVRDVLASLVTGKHEITTKWPNDVYVSNAKIAGILIETHKTQGGVYWAAIGIGVNLKSAPPLNDTRRAASLDSLGSGIAARDFLVSLDKNLATMLSDWPPASPAAFADMWAAHAYGIGSEVILNNHEYGQFLGIDQDGAARVMLDSGDETVVHAGDLIFKQLKEAANAAGD